MNRLRTLVLAGDAQARGRAHGASHPDAIRAYTDERMHLAGQAKWSGRDATEADVRALAEAMLPAHEAYDPDLYAELVAMAEAVGRTPAELMVCGGFTDFVDVVRARGTAPEEDDCTAFVLPDAMGGYYGQTWDMHDTATEHVVMLDVRAPGSPRALVFSTLGCVGQIGMNEAGLAIGITNLTASDGRIGVTWPFLVRRVLRETTVAAALALVESAPLAGGHSFLLRDAHGDGAMVERTSTSCATWRLADRALVHTNHCLAPATLANEAARAKERVESSVSRLRVATERLDVPAVTLADLVALTREPTAICQRSTAPFYFETSGAAIVRPETREFWAVWGIPADHDYERFVVDHG